ncbi:MAG: AGE family epimerase/isomerase [Rhodothermales bacterium]|nr:AGE family epimerase/isomerase [Rhodothermales bacterium]
MKSIDMAGALYADAHRELTHHILPYWTSRTVDATHGGFIGAITGGNVPDWRAPKGIVLNARILWTFSETARVLGDAESRLLAHRAFAYIRARFWDDVAGGAYWMVDYLGQPLDTKKYTYAQAFLMYALTAYHRATGNTGALDWAIDLFDLLEAHTADPAFGGYFEIYDATWRRRPMESLSPKDPVAAKSANTQLHVLEAYASLLRIWPDERLQRRLRQLLDLFLNTIVDPDTHHLRQAFDADWTAINRLVSFGHDIEASWLLCDAARTLGDPGQILQAEGEAIAMVRATLNAGVAPDGSLYNEATPHRLDEDRHWWPQAEAVVGFLNAYELVHEETFLHQASLNWTYIQRFIVDHDHGEWFFRVSRAGVPYLHEDKVGPWKCPYHNTRACLEIMERTARIQAMLAPSR